MRAASRALKTARRLFLPSILAMVVGMGSSAARAQLKIEVTSGVTDPIPIAVIPFARSVPADGGLDVAQVVHHDLEGSGRFRALPRPQMPATPTEVGGLNMNDWKTLGQDYVVVGRVVPVEGGNLAVDFDLLNTLTGQRIGGQRFVGTPGALRNAAHRVSDVIYERILGIRGAFATRIAYVAVDGQPPAQHFQLVVADADGENQRLILESRFPLMSPSWSPDGQWLAYVSFENKRSAIYVQLVKTGDRRQVSARAGINGAPAWSPDGRKLALTLGGSGGNPDLYVLELASQSLTRVTDDPSIDTEAAWSPDGKFLYFTSDRAGGPQIYRTGIQPGDRPKRMTFGGTYNARPRVSADGSQLAMVTLDNGSYRIAVQDLASGAVRVLSRGHSDESPSFAPNGATLIYSEREGANRASLATVSVDGLTGLRLKADQGEVREPAWGPFAQ
jgi:TolB protein